MFQSTSFVYRQLGLDDDVTIEQYSPLHADDFSSIFNQKWQYNHLGIFDPIHIKFAMRMKQNSPKSGICDGRIY
jgi:hypothetical protein